MVIGTKRSTKKTKRKALGETEAAPLIKWLNEGVSPKAATFKTNEAARLKLVAVLDDLALLGELEAGGEYGEIEAVITRINDALGRTKLVPQVQSTFMQSASSRSRKKGPDLAVWVEFIPSPGTADYAEVQVREIGKPLGLPYGYQATMMLIDVWRSGHIARIRRCKGCQKFLYAARPNTQKACSEKCRDAHHKSDEEYRKRWNENRRKNYAMKVARKRRIAKSYIGSKEVHQWHCSSAVTSGGMSSLSTGTGSGKAAGKRTKSLRAALRRPARTS